MQIYCGHGYGLHLAGEADVRHRTGYARCQTCDGGGYCGGAADGRESDHASAIGREICCHRDLGAARTSAHHGDGSRRANKLGDDQRCPTAVLGRNDPIAVFRKVAAVAVDNEEDERRRGGGGGGSGSLVATAAAKTTRRQSQPQAVAARAAIAAGAQPAVFKVISTAGTKAAAGALLEYLGTRPGEDGKKHDIEVFTSSGLRVETREQRRALLQEWQEDFRAPFQNTNFIEVVIELAGDPGGNELHDALNAAFGSKPFVYARTDSTVKAFAYSDMKAAVLAKALLKVDAENGRGAVLRRAEDKITTRVNEAGVAGNAEIKAAVSTERGGQYFLQKFIRANARVIRSDGGELPADQRADKAAKRSMPRGKRISRR